MNSYGRGLWAEYLALGFLMLKGYRFRALRYKTKVGEVDLVMARGRAVIFVEVKYRASSPDGAYAVTPRSQNRIRRAAQHYLFENGCESHKIDQEMRFDAVIISKFLFIKHIKNAF